MGSDGETSGAATGRRTDADRQAIVTEAFQVGHSVGEVAARRGVSAASIYLWRRQLRVGATGDVRTAPGRNEPRSRPPPSPVTFAPVQIATAPEAPASSQLTGPERIEISLANGRILKVCDGIDPVKLARLVAALERGAP